MQFNTQTNEYNLHILPGGQQICYHDKMY